MYVRICYLFYAAQFLVRRFMGMNREIINMIIGFLHDYNATGGKNEIPSWDWFQACVVSTLKGEVMWPLDPPFTKSCKGNA